MREQFNSSRRLKVTFFQAQEQRRAAFILSLALVFLPSLSLARSPSPTVPSASAEGVTINGLWEAVETPSSGISSALEVRGDGTCSSVVVVIVDSAFRVENGLIWLPAERTQGTPFQLTDKKLILGTGKEAIRHRRLSGSADSVLGSWKSKVAKGTWAYHRFLADGWHQFRLPMAVFEIRCSIEDGQLVLQAGGTPATCATYQASSDLLTLRPLDGNPVAMRRAGSWYPIKTDSSGRSSLLDKLDQGPAW